MRRDAVGIGEPIVLTGTLANGSRYVQLWTEHERIAGHEVRHCWVSMSDDPAETKERLIIHAGCPDALLPAVWDMFTKLQAGKHIEATHTVQWGQGDATFTPIDNQIGDER